MATEKKNKQKKDQTKEQPYDYDRERSSYYNNGGVYNPQTETGITGAYGSQGEKDRDNSYTASVKF
ncbi:hypothetical protein H0X48_02140 [Candidatus Dependentiae bacterium]|nr:hypothetical protein [Candidatus Dependentiae bacterium]